MGISLRRSLVCFRVLDEMGALHELDISMLEQINDNNNLLEIIEPQILTTPPNWWALLLCSRGNFSNTNIMQSTFLHLAIREIPDENNPMLSLLIRSQTKGYNQTCRESRFAYHVDEKNIFKIGMFLYLYIYIYIYIQ